MNISRFINEVVTELKKATWPWESDVKVKGIKKYKELIDSTVVVLVAMLFLAFFVNVWDLLLTKLVSKLLSFFTI